MSITHTQMRSTAMRGGATLVHPDLLQGKASDRVLEGFCAAEKTL